MFKIVDLFGGLGPFIFAAKEMDNPPIFIYDSNTVARQLFKNRFGITMGTSLDEIPPHDILIINMIPIIFPFSMKRTHECNEQSERARHELVVNFIIDMVMKHKPKVLIVDNVKVVKQKSPGIFKNFISNLTSNNGNINYRVAEGELKSTFFGIPQNRHRNFIIATDGSINEQFTLFDDNKPFDGELDITLGEFIGKPIVEKIAKTLKMSGR
jgi:site-specific DNA-cytosine methylase